MLSDPHRQALLMICRALEIEPRSGSKPRWALGGSLALALHGLPVGCRDIDLLTTAADAVRLTELPGTKIEPVRFRTRPRLRGHIGRIRVHEVEVEILGDVENELADGSWSAPPPLGDELEHIDFEGHSCPIFALTALRAAYEAMERPEKVALIDEGMA